MLTLHIGTPKTATTSCQRLLAEVAPQLTAFDVLYPEQFRNRENIAHHTLATEFLDVGLHSSDIVKEFFEYLRSNRTKSIIISSEAFSNALTPEKIEEFIEFLKICQKIMTTKVVIVLRRMDHYIESLYLHQVKQGYLEYGIDKFVTEQKFWPNSLLENLANVRNSQHVNSLLCLKYRSGPHFQNKLLLAMVPEHAHDSIKGKSLRSGERLGLKSQSILFEFSKILKKDNIDYDRKRFIRDLSKKKISFQGDRTDYHVLPHADAIQFHVNALAAAYRWQELDYVTFFGETNIRPRPAISLGLEHLSQADLDKLTKFLRRQSSKLGVDAAPKKLRFWSWSR